MMIPPALSMNALHFGGARRKQARKAREALKDSFNLTRAQQKQKDSLKSCIDKGLALSAKQIQQVRKFFPRVTIPLKPNDHESTITLKERLYM